VSRGFLRFSPFEPVEDEILAADLGRRAPAFVESGDIEQTSRNMDGVHLSFFREYLMMMKGFFLKAVSAMLYS